MLKLILGLLNTILKSLLLVLTLSRFHCLDGLVPFNRLNPSLNSLCLLKQLVLQFGLDLLDHGVGLFMTQIHLKLLLSVEHSLFLENERLYDVLKDFISEVPQDSVFLVGEQRLDVL